MANTEKDPALEKAIRNVGSSRALAEALCVTAQALSQWRRVPIGRVIEVERISGIPRQELRPDFYPAQESGEGVGQTTQAAE